MCFKELFDLNMHNFYLIDITKDSTIFSDEQLFYKTFSNLLKINELEVKKDKYLRIN